MQRVLRVVAAVAIAAPALAADVGVSVSVGQPGFYGRIDIGDLPPPHLVYAQPLVIQPAPVGVTRDPVYLHVPPGHARNWRKHCARYGACGQPVYFVQQRWYEDVYVPHSRGVYPSGPIARATDDGYRPRTAYFAPTAPALEYRAPPPERFYEVPISSVRAVVGRPEQRCWVERRQVVDDRGGPNVPGAIVGAVVGGVLGHQIGGGRGRDIATAGGAVAGAAIGANVGRGPAQVYSQDVQRCTTVDTYARPEYWDLTYTFRGVVHRVQTSTPPGRTIMVDGNGAPRS